MMKKFKIGFFEEAPNVGSFTRLGAGIVIISAVLWGFIDVTASIFVERYDSHEGLILGALTIAFSAKVFQKPKENGESEEES